MNTKALVVTVVGIGCVAAAGVGGYLGGRTTAGTPAAAQVAEAPATPVVEAVAPAVSAATPASRQDASAPGPAPMTRASRRPEPAPAPAQASEAVMAPPSLPTADIHAPDEAPLPQEPNGVAMLPPPPAPTADERTVPTDTVIGIRLDSAVSSETARVEDRVLARVTRDVKVDGDTVIPAGARLEGTVTVVDRGGKFRERSRIGVRFTTLTVTDERIPIRTDTIFREGDPPGGEATSKIGASAVVGSILGAVIGGRKGAAIGGAAGAAGGTAAVMKGGRNAAEMELGTPLTVRLTDPVTVLVPREE